VSRLPIRARLTATFAAAMVLVLAAAGLFVYIQLRADLDEAIDTGLRARTAAVAAGVRKDDPAPAEAGPGGGEERDEGFAVVLAPGGRVLDGVGGARGLVVGASDLERVAAGGVVSDERRIEGIEGTARVLARRASAGPGSPVVAAGQSLEDRDETLSGLVAAFALGGPAAVALASLIGYGLAAAGLAPVEAMRRRATEVSLTGGEERLPLPAAGDEIRRLGETLNDMLDRLRRSFERERRFVADASHELRTPVAVVKTELEGALRTGDYGPQVREALVAAVEECDHLSQLAEDLLVVARAADGQLPVRAETLEASSLLAGVRERFSDRAAQHGRNVRIESPPDLMVWGDPLRLRQALGNLLDNALRHGGGEIVLAARPGDGRIELDVSDGGRGFEGGILERAFERFSRGDEARGRSGTGLGLAIVRTVAEAHGGRAEIVHDGPHTTVRVSIPAAEATPPGTEIASSTLPAVWQAPSRGDLR